MTERGKSQGQESTKVLDILDSDRSKTNYVDESIQLNVNSSSTDKDIMKQYKNIEIVDNGRC